MPTLNHEYIKIAAEETKYGKGQYFRSLPKSTFNAFTPEVLGLGDISREGSYIQALAAVFDLEGFTAFCNQVDSHLVLPEFLTRYLEWLFTTLREKFKEGEDGKRVKLWSDLPFFTKFLGDGLMFLWDTTPMLRGGPIRNIVITSFDITREYCKIFLPEIRRHVSNPPHRLRCGIARGQVVSVGNQGDYVGSCINIAARLQKLASLSFAVSRRGLDFSTPIPHTFFQRIVLKRVALRGIGADELVYVLSEEFDNLTPDDRASFIEVTEDS